MRSEQLEAVVSLLRAGHTGGAPMTIDEWRRAYDSLGAMLAPRAGVSATGVDADGVPAEWIGEGDAVVVYLHGGGYCIGSLTSHRSMLTHLAAETGARVLAVDYRLAPEHPFPAALDDAVTACRFAIRTAGARRVVIAGDSAGGGLTIATLLALRDAGDPPPAAGVCLSPWIDLTQSGTTTMTKAGEDPMVHVTDLERWAAMYAGPDGAARPLVSPLFAELRDLPPLLVEVGTAEVLLDDARRLATRALGAGVDVTLFEGEDLIHVWHFFAGSAPEADAGITRVADFVRTRVGDGT
jgi:phosphinothricin tripeptide acetyl hydrolase